MMMAASGVLTAEGRRLGASPSIGAEETGVQTCRSTAPGAAFTLPTRRDRQSAGRLRGDHQVARQRRLWRLI